MFDFGSIQIGGVGLLLWIPGATQFLKELFNVSGKAATVLAFSVGAAAMGLFQVIQFAPAEWIPYIEAVFLSITMGMSAAGYYKLAAPVLRANGS